jgi:O-6-methylguanine DNA methyltransferase
MRQPTTANRSELPELGSDASSGVDDDLIPRPAPVVRRADAGEGDDHDDDGNAPARGGPKGQAAAPDLDLGRLVLPGPVSRELGVGALELAWSERGLCRLAFAGPDRGRSDPNRTVVPFELAEPLLAFLEGDAGLDLVASLPLDLRGTPFQSRVWEALAHIPPGEVRSYRQVAQAIGSPRATRAVGQAVGRNPLLLVIPCHRVVHADRRLGGYSGGGPERKRRLLRREGVSTAGGRIVPGQLPLAISGS